MRKHIELGKFRLYPLDAGSFRLDGGAMFGIVPKTLWTHFYQADENNRIQLSMRPLLVEAGGQWILVDTGAGDKFDQKWKEIYGITSSPDLQDELADVGLRNSDINIVVNTHLHWDHAGGNTVRDTKTGEWAPAFPNARYIVQRGEFDFAMNANERTRGSYRPDDFANLEKQKVFDFVDGDATLAPGVKVVQSGGHVPFHQCVLLESNKNRSFFLGDLIPTHAHLPLPYIMGFDLDPLLTLERKKEYLSKASEEDWLLFFVHDPDMACARIRRTNSRFEAVPVLPDK
jgi:glyoxylase-like metal-dependent hydrolase (beta-lactamase superfamily II)